MDGESFHRSDAQAAAEFWKEEAMKARAELAIMRTDRNHWRAIAIGTEAIEREIQESRKRIW